jgi:chromosome segregation ATPase
MEINEDLKRWAERMNTDPSELQEILNTEAHRMHEEHTQVGALIKELQAENAKLKEKKARAEEHIRTLSSKLSTANSTANSWQLEARNTTSAADQLSEENQALRQRNSILEAAMAGFGAILRGVRS